MSTIAMKREEKLRSSKSTVSSEGDETQKGLDNHVHGAHVAVGNSPTDIHEEARSGEKRKATKQTIDQDRKHDRRAANRLSAFQSRQRRKMIIEDLQKTVAEQSKHNADQAQQIAELKRQIQVAKHENELLRGQVGSTSSLPSPSPLHGGLGQFATNPDPLPTAQPQSSVQERQQNQLLQNTMLQNALLLSVQAQLGDQSGALDLLRQLGLTSGQTSNMSAGRDRQNDFSAT